MRVDEFEKFIDSLYSNKLLMAQNILNYIKYNPNLLPQEIIDIIHIEDTCKQCQKIGDAYDKGMDDGYIEGQTDGKAEGVEFTLDYLHKVISKDIQEFNTILELLENTNVYDLI